MERAPSDIDIACAEEWLRTGTPAVVVTITKVSGSAPREAGAAMLVTHAAISGTIGGGALEWALIGVAREMLRTDDQQRVIEQALGPEIGQCCGGKVRATLFRLTKAAISKLCTPEKLPSILIFGAGHVGAALARALAPLPLNVEVIDQRAKLLAPLADYGRVTETALPESHVAAALPGAAYIVTTHDHALDFMIVEAAIARGDAAYVGMIGSTSKRAVLAGRLSAAGLSDETLICPIGAGLSRDKRPEVIAAITAGEIISVLL